MDLIDKIRLDRSSGAKELSIKSLNVFERIVGKMESQDSEETRRMILETAGKIACAQPSMASVFNCMNNLFPVQGKSVWEIRKHALMKAKSEEKRIKGFDRKISENGARLIDNDAAILTLSASSSVFGILKHGSAKVKKIFVCESHPGGEGALFAKSISSFARPSLISDFSFRHFIREVDLVLVGADAVSPTHLTNKCGTGLIAEEANRRHIEVLCACDTNKIIPFNPPIKEFLRHNKKIIKREILFDRTPLRLIARFVTEGGILTHEKMSRLASKRKKNMILPI